VAALVGMQAMMFAEAAWLDPTGQMPAATREMFRWLTLLLCTPVVFWCGMPILSGMRRELALLRPGMDTLAGSSILLAYGASVVETLRGGPQVWFDAAAMFVFFLLLARVIERFARDRAGERLDLLARAQPQLAWRLRAGALEQVPALELQAGDEVRVRDDETLPADGELLDEQGEFDEALLSGESAPVRKQRGDFVLAGSRACLAGAGIRVTAVGADTRLAQLQQLVQDAQERRPALARAADRAARLFVVAMFAAAIGTFCWWLPQGAGVAFPIALSVLVAACPCALALAVPASLSAAADAMARRGVLVVGTDAIEGLAKVDTVRSTRPARSPTARRGCARCSVSRPRVRRRLAGRRPGARQPASLGTCLRSCCAGRGARAPAASRAGNRRLVRRRALAPGLRRFPRSAAVRTMRCG
jgi:Cu2+-exporting ATPase